MLTSFRDWAVLKEGRSKGIYVQDVSTEIDDLRMISWLVETSLCARANGAAALRDMLESPELFPFRIERVSAGGLLAVSPFITRTPK